MPIDPLVFSEEVISKIYSNNNPDCNFIFNDTLNSSNTKMTSKSNSNFHSKHFSSPNESPAANANDKVDSNIDKTTLSVELSPILASFTTIMSRYINSDIVIKSLFRKIVSITDGEFILYANLIRTINTSMRPSANMRQQIIDELHEAGIIKISTGFKNTSIKI